MKKALVAGWFSLAEGHATAGDLLARDLVCSWLKTCDFDYDIATDPPFTGGLNWRQTDPRQYSHVIFVCGPFNPGPREAEFLDRFGCCRLIGLNISMHTPLKTWNPFDLLIPRDSSAETNADLVFLTNQNRVPVVGLCLIEERSEAKVDLVNKTIAHVLTARELAVVPIDTRLDTNETGLRTPREIESLISKMDALVTTRLHGVVLALKNSVPVVALDAVVGGGKISKQCARIGWNNVLSLGEIDEQQLAKALDYALTGEARSEAQVCAQRAANLVRATSDRFVAALHKPREWEKHFNARQNIEGMEAFRASLPLARLVAERGWRRGFRWLRRIRWMIVRIRWMIVRWILVRVREWTHKTTSESGYEQIRKALMRGTSNLF